MPNYFTTAHIRRMYERCHWRSGELENQLQTITVATGKVYRLHARKIFDNRLQIAHILTCNLRQELMRSYPGSKGMPWFSAKYDRKGLPLGDLQTVEQMLALGVAAGCVTVYRKTMEGIDGSIPFVIIENRRVRDWELTEKRRLK